MEYRLGTCSSCKARYKVPATFTAARARCKSCGGAVEFGAVLSDVPRPPRQENARPERSERPERAERQERQERREPRRESQPAAPRPVRPLPPPAEQPAPARSAAPAPAAPAVPTVPTAPPAQADAPARRTPARERASAAPARAPAPAEKQGNGPLIAGAIVLSIAVVAAIVWYVMRQRSASAAEIAARAPTPAEALAPKESTETPPAPRLAERALDADLAQMADFDLATLPELEPLAGVDAAAQRELADQVALFVDESSGDAGRRAGDALVARGKAAMPAILDALKSVDLATEAGNRAGERIQEQLLARICNGATFGWKRGLDPASVSYDEKAIAMWFRAWAAARESDAAWDALAGKPGAPRQ